MTFSMARSREMWPEVRPWQLGANGVSGLYYHPCLPQMFCHSEKPLEFILRCSRHRHEHLLASGNEIWYKTEKSMQGWWHQPQIEGFTYSIRVAYSHFSFCFILLNFFSGNKYALYSNGNYSNSNHTQFHALLHIDTVFCLEFLFMKNKRKCWWWVFKIHQFYFVK